MPRLKRALSQNGMYYVFATGELTKLLAPNKEDKACLIDLFFDLKSTYNFDIIAYAITNNEFHICLKEYNPLEISEIMRVLFSRYTAYYNSKYQLKGKLLHDRFKSNPIDTLEELKVAVRYIHQIPVRLLEHPNVFSYEFSSYREYFEEGLVHTQTILDTFSPDPVQARTKFKVYHSFLELSNLKGEQRPQYSDEGLDQIVQKATDKPIEEIRVLDRQSKYSIVRLLKKKTTLSLRQIEKATGVSRATISKL